MDQVTPNLDSPVWATLEAITDKSLWHLYTPHKYGFYEWKEEVCDRITKVTNRPVKQQIINQQLTDFVRMFLPLMDARCGPAWKKVRDALPMPSENAAPVAFVSGRVGRENVRKYHKGEPTYSN